jgi:lysophospholipase L1-like esterase
MKISVIIAVLFLSAVVHRGDAQTPYDSLYLTIPAYQQLTAQFESTKLHSADIVMLGNSITYGGLWNDLLGKAGVVNRGIGGDNTVGMLHRLHSVYNLHPKICFIMAGINDIYADASVDVIFSNYRKIVDTLRSKQIIPVIQSTLFVNPKWKLASEKNREVAALNALLKDYAAKESIEFIDLNAVLSQDNTLLARFTTDGVHLTAEAYIRWRTLLEPVLKSHGL